MRGANGMKLARWIAASLAIFAISGFSRATAQNYGFGEAQLAQYQSANPGFGGSENAAYQNQSAPPAPAPDYQGSGLIDPQSFNLAPHQTTASAAPSPSFTQDATQVKLQPKRQAHTQAPLDGGITARDLQVLGQHDVAVVVDRSGSMSTYDCPGISPNSGGGWERALAGLISPGLILGPGMGGRMTMSRWDFVCNQTMALAKQTQQIFPGGITLVLFSSHCKVFPNVDLRQIPNIFAANHPWGSTNTAEALELPIGDYFRRRQQSGGKVKPLVIAVVTDGMPTNPNAVRQLLIQTTRYLHNPHEIRITFLQIGTEREGYDLLEEFAHNLVNEGAQFDIVDTKTFPEVVRQGLARSLVDAIESNGL